MTQEKEDLLLKDLCARLPYGVVLKVDYIINDETTYGEDVPATCDDKLLRINLDEFSVYTEWLMEYSGIGYIKPYLRPMSSMTEEERKDFYDNLRPKYDGKPWESMVADADWFNAHHFDYRNLIEKGLALEAPEGMYK